MDTSSLKKYIEVNQDEILARIIYIKDDMLDLNQTAFATAIGISQSYYSLLISGKKSVSLKLLEGISENLKVNFDWLVYGKNTYNSTNEITYTAVKLQNSINIIKDYYVLNDDDVNFIKSFVTSSKKERKDLLKSLKNLSTIAGNIFK